MLTSRERVTMALNHQQPDRAPLDLGASAVTGMHASSVYQLRQALGLDAPGTPVKVVEPYQMLGEIAPDLREALGVDVVGLGGPRNMFGYPNQGWKPWTFFDGTPLLVPEGFNTHPEPNGELLMYAGGDRSAPPCARMPRGGWYFDSIERQAPLDEAALNVDDNLEEFGLLSEADLGHYRRESERLWNETSQAILLSLPGTGFGDIALVPAPGLKRPKGIRGVEEWYISTVTRREYVREVFQRQCAIALENLPRLYKAVGERAAVAFVSGTDFGAQNNCFISPKSFCDLYQPFLRQINDWIHTHTGWKTMIHSCGSVQPLIPHFIEAGFDILNPVQTSAVNMDAGALKERFGAQVTFWGGGVDTQKTLPFGSVEDVQAEVRERLRVFGARGGFVFNTIHNVQAGTPVENLVAMYAVVKAGM
jgi:hypothetical protein